MISNEEMVNFCNNVLLLKKEAHPLNKDQVEFSEGVKYFRVFTVTPGISGSSVYCFVDKSNGDIYKPASWKAPAKGIRGNIKTMTGLTPYGTVYFK